MDSLNTFKVDKLHSIPRMRKLATHGIHEENTPWKE